ncbi:cytochrome B5-like protein [Ananas comosus]|uniref:Cytochrome B5-like protein n=1 Tax=Ananas comosus TaxID=4615 RepID=A0A199UUV5_ANACO|nr:cytochrome B5-like protein [Ananas comosus]OAY68568.1 Cytochrome B5-like protein [Ananas comosus]
MEMIVITLVVLFVIGALFIIPRSHSSKGKANTAPSNVNGKTARTYTKKEVSVHNTRKDCWIIIKDKVYDVTPYVEEHPGGDAILNNAGGDSTEGFYGPQHASRVFDMVDEFYIGDLKP